jgi:hypothetical protein
MGHLTQCSLKIEKLSSPLRATGLSKEGKQASPRAVLEQRDAPVLTSSFLDIISLSVAAMASGPFQTFEGSL